MQNHQNHWLGVGVAVFLALPGAAVSAEPAQSPSAWISTPQSCAAWTASPAADAPSRESEVQQLDLVWIEGRWVWDDESGQFVWFPGYLTLPILGDAAWDVDRTYESCFGSDFSNSTFGCNFVISGGSPVIVQGGTGPVSEHMAWYQSIRPLNFVANIGTHIGAQTQTISRTVWDGLNTAAVTSGKHLSEFATQAAAVSGKHLAEFASQAAVVGAKATVIGVKVAVVAAHVAVHMLKK